MNILFLLQHTRAAATLDHVSIAAQITVSPGMAQSASNDEVYIMLSDCADSEAQSLVHLPSSYEIMLNYRDIQEYRYSRTALRKRVTLNFEGILNNFALRYQRICLGHRPLLLMFFVCDRLFQ